MAYLLNLNKQTNKQRASLYCVIISRSSSGTRGGSGVRAGHATLASARQTAANVTSAETSRSLEAATPRDRSAVYASAEARPR